MTDRFTKEWIEKQREVFQVYSRYRWGKHIQVAALDHIERLQERIAELETQLKSKDIIINNQQGRLNYYATKDLLGGKND